MKALVIKNQNGKIEIENVPKPKPRFGELLIKNEGSPINPADLNMIFRGYKDLLKKQDLVILGIEGIGTVVEVGDESLKSFLNQTVTFPSGGGSYAEYTITYPYLTMALDPTSLGEKEWPSWFNPITAMCMLDIARKSGTKCIVQTGANSACAKMLIKICKVNNIETINLVRNIDQIQYLKDIGGTYVIDQTDKDFKTTFSSLMKKCKPKVCFECIAGEFGGLIFNLMPKKSTMYLYGSLSLQPLGRISPVEMIYGEKDILHLIAIPYLTGLPDNERSSLINEAKLYYKNYFGSQVAKFISFEQINEGVKYYQENMSKGKIIVKPKF